MFGVSQANAVLTIASILMCAGLVIRLHSIGLHRRYQTFCLYIAYQAARALILLPIPRESEWYPVIWICTKPLQWLLGMWVIKEIYTAILSRYPGVATLMKWMLAAVGTLSFLLSALFLPMELQHTCGKLAHLHVPLAIQRTLDTASVLCVLIPLLIAAAFPLKLSRNLVVHCIVFSACTGFNAAGIFVSHILGDRYVYDAQIHVVRAAGFDLCLMAWLLFLTRQGERLPKISIPDPSPQVERLLLNRLHTFNHLLERHTHL